MTDFVPIIKFFFYYVSLLSQVREIRIIGAIIVTRWVEGYAHNARPLRVRALIPLDVDSRQ